MHPVLFAIGPVDVSVYSVMIGLGIGAGTFLALWLARHKGGWYQDRIWEFGTYGVLGALAGARLWEVLWVWAEFADRPWARFAIWEGGMSIQGAVLGGLATALLYARLRALHTWEFLDLLAPGVALGQGIGRIGCLFNGDAFGRPVADVAWWPSWLGAVYAEGTPAWLAYGAQPLVPAEALEGLADFAICGLLLWYKPAREFHGRKALTYGISYSVVRFSLEFLRADSLRFGGMKVAQVLSLLVVVLCGLLFWHRTRGTAGALQSQQ